jgi:hypothetical protein
MCRLMCVLTAGTRRASPKDPRLDQRKVKRRLKNQAQAGRASPSAQATRELPAPASVALRCVAFICPGRRRPKRVGQHVPPRGAVAVPVGPCPSLVLPQQPQARREDYWRRQNGDLAHLSSCSCAHAGYEGAVVVGGMRVVSLHCDQRVVVLGGEGPMEHDCTRELASAPFRFQACSISPKS